MDDSDLPQESETMGSIRYTNCGYYGSERRQKSHCALLHADRGFKSKLRGYGVLQCDCVDF